MDTGIDVFPLNKRHFRTKTKKRLALEAELLRTMEFYDEGRVSIFTTVNGPMTVETAIKNAAPLYRDAARRAFQTLAIGRGMK